MGGVPSKGLEERSRGLDQIRTKNHVNPKDPSTATEGRKEWKRFFGVINTDYDKNFFKHSELIFEKLDGGDADKKICGNS